MHLLSHEELMRYGNKGWVEDPQWPFTLEELLKKPLLRKLPHRMVGPKDRVGWLGSEGVMLIRSDDTVHDVLHEFCHYLMASKSRLSLNEFGLGKGFRYNSLHAERSMTDAQCYDEELRVCVLTYSIEKRLRIPTKVIGHGIMNECFQDLSEKEYNSIVQGILKCCQQIKDRCGLNVYSPK